MSVRFVAVRGKAVGLGGAHASLLLLANVKRGVVVFFFFFVLQTSIERERGGGGEKKERLVREGLFTAAITQVKTCLVDVPQC